MFAASLDWGFTKPENQAGIYFTLMKNLWKVLQKNAPFVNDPWKGQATIAVQYG